MLFGLIYVLNWRYATELKCTFEENPGYNQAVTKELSSNDNWDVILDFILRGEIVVLESI